MRVIVCGGRDYDEWEYLCRALDHFHAKKGITLLIEGGARGADAHAAVWADTNMIPRCTFHANWEKLGRKAGPERNKAMLTLGMPDAVIAFPGGKGTKGMCLLAENAGVKIWRPGNA